MRCLAAVSLRPRGSRRGPSWPRERFAHPAIGKVKGANERLNFAILGPGGRAQAHIGVPPRHEEARASRSTSSASATSGTAARPSRARRIARVTRPRRHAGSIPSAKRCGLDVNDKKNVTKDYRRILDSKDIDAVVIATPDHWHAKMAIDAMEAGKDVYCEKPMTHTIDEAREIAETVKKTEQVFTVGVQSTADPRWRQANEMITAGKIGHVMQGQTSYYRNSDGGQWRYYGLSKDMNPKTVDWKMFLGTDFGLAPDQPFNRAQLRPVALLLGLRRRHVHRPVRAPAHAPDPGDGRPVPAPGRRRRRPVPRVRRPRRARRRDGGGRLRRGLPGHHLGHDVQRRAARRGDPRPHRHDPLRGRGEERVPVAAQKLEGRPAPPARTAARAARSSRPSSHDDDTRALWNHFIECIRSRNPETLCPAETGYAAIATVNLGVQSYREGKAYYFDKETGKVSDADESWSAKWESDQPRSAASPTRSWAGRPVRLRARLLHAPDYQKLEGDWVDGKDPAENA